jgi:hypothetical protein
VTRYPSPARPAASASADPGPLRISFLGFNPLGSGYDGRGKIDAGADQTFTSLDTVGALRLVRRHFGLGTRLAPAAPPFDLRITGYSFGGWSALQLAHALAPLARHLRIRVGLVDPVGTFRFRRVYRLALTPWRIAPARVLPLPALSGGPAYASRPAGVDFAVSYFQAKGLIARYNGDGFRLPFRARWFASQPVEGFENHDVTAEVTAGGGHVEIAEKYAALVARQTFGG